MQMTNSEGLKLVNLIWILGFWVKTGELDGSQAENKMKKNCKIEPFKC